MTRRSTGLDYCSGANTFGWYVAAMMLISAITVITIPETKGIDMRDVR